MTMKRLQAPFDGGCACGAVRYRMHALPLFVHCCHCTRCQRETGSPFAHHAMIEFTALTLLQGEPDFVPVPTDSGSKHWVARCGTCRSAMWNEHGTRKAIIRYVRVGTLDEPAAFPPLAHIFTRSKQPWLALPDDGKHYQTYYEVTEVWPIASQMRYKAAERARRRMPVVKLGGLMTPDAQTTTEAGSRAAK